MTKIDQKWWKSPKLAKKRPKKRKIVKNIANTIFVAKEVAKIGQKLSNFKYLNGKGKTSPYFMISDNITIIVPELRL